jgi:hypothetical protein
VGFRQAGIRSGVAKTTVWLANADGTGAVKLGPGQQPLLSPNGNAVAASLIGQSTAGLAIYTPGAATKTYFSNAHASANGQAWSPDSRYLAVTLTSSETSGKGSGLAIIDTSTGSVKTLAKGSVCGASFAPSGPDRLVYARSPGSFACFAGHVNVFTVAADATGRKQITSDGRSANPVWGPHSIVFDHITPRKHVAPAYQLWTMRTDGSHRVQITHMKIPPLVDGLVPMQFSASGKRLLAAYEGQDTSETWTVVLSSDRARQLKVGGQSVIAGSLSRSGNSVVVAAGALDTAPSHGTVESVGFGGGRAKVLVRHAAEPSWNK